VWLMPYLFRLPGKIPFLIESRLMAKVAEEVFEVVDEDDRIVGQAYRSQCHGNPDLIHRVAHVLVFNSRGEVLLQKRSMSKDIQPGRWDTSVGGHLMPGEDYLEAARREAREELGLENPELTFLYYSKIRNSVESENVATFCTVADGPFDFDRSEIEALRFWWSEDILNQTGKGVFTPNFEEEWRSYRQWIEARGEAPCGEKFTLA